MAKELKKAVGKPSEILKLINSVTNMLRKERKNDKALFHLPASGNAIVVGDLHGDLESLSFILRHCNPPKDYIIFLGDYGDRGPNSPEVFYTILNLKKRFPNKVILLRGNHEGPRDIVFHPHDLPYRLMEKYGKEGRRVYEELRKFFDYLHNAAILEGKYLFVHGGIPSNINSLDDIALAHKSYPKSSTLIEILWNDPDDNLNGTVFNYDRGIGRKFGKDVTERILKKLRLKTLIRSHQPPLEGVAVNHEGMVFTLSSTKVYGGKAAFLKLDLKEEKNAFQLSRAAFKF